MKNLIFLLLLIPTLACAQTTIEKQQDGSVKITKIVTTEEIISIAELKKREVDLEEQIIRIDKALKNRLIDLNLEKNNLLNKINEFENP